MKKIRDFALGLRRPAPPPPKTFLPTMLGVMAGTFLMWIVAAVAAISFYGWLL